MKIVVAFEGIDGAGKSSLADCARRLCQQHGRPFTAVGRREASANPLVGRLTQLIRDETDALTPRADVFLRIARDYQRASLTAAVPSGLVVLDRFVLSILSLVRLRGQEVRTVFPILRDLAARAHLFATVFVRCPFEVARRRVRQRNPEWSFGPGYEERLQEHVPGWMEHDFRRGRITGHRWLVDNSGSREDAERQLAEHLLPYLRGG
jgi:thymidylate kinase